MAERIRKYPRYSRIHSYALIVGVVAIIAGFGAFLLFAKGDFDGSGGEGGISVDGASSLLEAVEDTISGEVAK